VRTISHSLCSVIPPHMLRHVAEHTDAEEKAVIEATLAQTERLREQREAPRAFRDVKPSPQLPPKGCNVYDTGHHHKLPGRLVLSDAKSGSTDAEAIEALLGSRATLAFYATVFGRNSVDGRGMRIDSSVHYGNRFDNAMWNGRQMIYGDGDGKVFNRFTACIDVIGHELTHGITQYTAGLEHGGQSGALNEHISDAFGIMVKQYALGLSAAESDWLIGAGLLRRDVKGRAVRSMAAPGTAYDDPVLGRDPQPAHMRDYVVTSEDDGGVHVNCSIPNHAFYLAAIAAGGKTWDVIGRIWYAVLTGGLSPAAQFQEFADATVTAAGELYGANGRVQRLVKEAWAQVGILASRSDAPRLPIRNTPVQEQATALRAPNAKWRNRPATTH